MTFDPDTLHDYVVSHGMGAPTEQGYALAEQLMIDGDDYATAATEVVARGLTDDSEAIPATQAPAQALRLPRVQE